MSETEVDTEVEAAADVVRSFGHHAGRRWFAGVVPDHERRRITVFRVPGPGFDGEVRALVADTVGVDFLDATHPRDDLTAAREAVWLLGDALEIESVSLPPDGTRLTVVVGVDADEAQHRLDAVAPGLTRAVSRLPA